MEKEKEVIATPSVMPETQKVMDKLREEGHTFDGDEPKKEPEKSEVEPKKEEVKTEEVETESEKQPDEEKTEHSERKPREPKQVPAWQAAIEKKRVEKEMEDKSESEKQELRSVIDELKSEINNLKGAKQEKKEEIDDWIDKLVETKGVDVNVDFLKDFAGELLKRVPKQEANIPTDLPKVLESVANMESKAEKEKEDYEYNSSFGKEVIPKLKEEYPQITDEEVENIREAMKKPYFSERFITLSSGEIYELTKSSFKDLIAPERRQSVEKGTRGASRNATMLDYSNLTEDDYKNMTPSEREDANKFLLGK